MNKFNYIIIPWVLLGSIPITVVALLIYNTNESASAFYKDTEEKQYQHLKFEACFENIKESIILISEG